MNTTWVSDMEMYKHVANNEEIDRVVYGEQNHGEIREQRNNNSLDIHIPPAVDRAIKYIFHTLIL